MSQGVLPQSSTPSSLTVAPSGSVLMRTLTIATGGGDGSVGAAADGGATRADAAAAALDPPTPVAPGRNAAYPTMPTTARTPTTAVTRTLFEPFPGGGLDTIGPVTERSPGVAGASMLPEPV